VPLQHLPRAGITGERGEFRQKVGGEQHRVPRRSVLRRSAQDGTGRLRRQRQDQVQIRRRDVRHIGQHHEDGRLEPRDPGHDRRRHARALRRLQHLDVQPFQQRPPRR
jgi:hypothetical protein